MGGGGIRGGGGGGGGQAGGVPALLPAEELRQRGGHAEARLFGQRPADAAAIPCKENLTPTLTLSRILTCGRRSDSS